MRQPRASGCGLHLLGILARCRKAEAERGPGRRPGREDVQLELLVRAGSLHTLHPSFIAMVHGRVPAGGPSDGCGKRDTEGRDTHTR
eukprot:scaffold14089_cov33-Tisochrysis_lutea.AAC.1